MNKKGEFSNYYMASCQNCDEHFDKYKDVKKAAIKHAKKHGHIIEGQMGTVFTYDGTFSRIQKFWKGVNRLL